MGSWTRNLFDYKYRKYKQVRSLTHRILHSLPRAQHRLRSIRPYVRVYYSPDVESPSMFSIRKGHEIQKWKGSYLMLIWTEINDMILKRISIVLSIVSLCITFILNYLILKENISFSILGQYGDYSFVMQKLGAEKIIPLFIGCVSLIFGLLTIKKADKYVYFPIGLSIFAILLSMIPIWKLLFDWMKYY